MLRNSSFPKLYNEVKQISISKLKKWGYLSCKKEGSINWLRNEKVFSSISISSAKDRISLSYNWQEQLIEYDILITYTPSNLGKGLIPYFLCSISGKRCRNLYFLNGNFVHRTTYGGAYYESQIRSKNMREVEKIFGEYFNYESLYSELNSKYFKKTYQGKPTKRFLELNRKLKKAQNIDLELLNIVMITGKV